MKLSYYSALVVVGLWGMTACNKGAEANLTTLIPEEFNATINSLPNEQLVDVRTPEEFAAGHLVGAANLNFDAPDFAQQIKQLDKTKPVMVYCFAGGRSAEAAKILQNEGYNVYDMSDGFRKWKELNLPTEGGEATAEAQEEPAGEGVISLAAFKSKIAGNKAVLVDFNAEWCKPCKMMKPTIEKLAQEMATDVEVVMVDVDKSEEVATAYNIEAMPTLMIFKQSKAVWEKVGLTNEDELRAAITQNK